MRHLSITAALVAVAAVVATPASARAVRTLQMQDAKVAAFDAMIADAKAKIASTGESWINVPPTCSRRAGTWVRCRYIISESPDGKVHPVQCKRTVDVRLRSGRPAPVMTKHALVCAPRP